MANQLEIEDLSELLRNWLKQFSSSWALRSYEGQLGLSPDYGETTYVVSRLDSGWIRLGDSSKGGPPVYFGDFCDLDGFERWFVMYQNGGYRLANKLPFLDQDTTAASVAPGFQVRPVTLFIDSQPVPGEELIEGELAIARFRSFPGLKETEAAGASWFLGASLETIIKSCSSPTGAPLFTAKNR
ncbi:hypothetical protein D9V34_08735 [Mycetocola lacteus]|uniref:Uncharacterized protein n=1 Tax=Mycetocola lacteus TaxID=76637 RepID=A0A3L7AS09_9MICO|nr:hypothetical protein [Mycetocola lacteus]RLP83299.1 hypothetical protein D9V34_08735 [Mycetocola lacteus]